MGPCRLFGRCCLPERRRGDQAPGHHANQRKDGQEDEEQEQGEATSTQTAVIHKSFLKYKFLHKKISLVWCVYPVGFLWVPLKWGGTLPPGDVPDAVLGRNLTLHLLTAEERSTTPRVNEWLVRHNREQQLIFMQNIYYVKGDPTKTVYAPATKQRILIQEDSHCKAADQLENASREPVLDPLEALDLHTGKTRALVILECGRHSVDFKKNLEASIYACIEKSSVFNNISFLA